MRVAFFQRIFARYQAGLVKELAASSVHSYGFFGGDQDPLASGIEPLDRLLIDELPYTVCRTVHWGPHCAFQWRSVWCALTGVYDVLILEGGASIVTNWLAIIIARIRNKRVLLYTHGWLRVERGLKKIVKNAFYRLADGLLLYGKRGRDFGIASGFDPRRLYVVYNSLDDEPICRQRRALSAAACDEFIRTWFGAAHVGCPLVVSVGRLNTIKEYPLLLEACAILNRERGIDLSLMLAGDGPERAVLEEQARELDVRLVMAGARYDEEFLGLMIAAASMMVIPGAAGLSVIHSLSYGTPVVVHDDDDAQGPEAEAVMEGVNGAHFSRGDAADLARAMLTVLSDLPKTHAVRECCRQVVDQAYSPGRMREAFDQAVSGYPA
ncbi:MAG TPA: glycosyltransferase family 4 protein [Bacteroidota bacterium]|nr:glycosyltransferase family 4 protein [Bacteroidota bacterium]